MMRTRLESAIPAALTLGFALTLPISATAQVTNGPGLSSGSGAGTGTGYSSGVQRSQSGSISGVGPAPATGRRSGGGGGYAPSPVMNVPAGPGVETHFPDDTTLFPMGRENLLGGGRTNPPDLAQVPLKEFENARAVADPGDRCLSLQRLANVAVFSSQLPLAHRALAEATDAVFQISDPLVRDLRLMAIITTLDYLSEAYLREGKLELGAPGIDDPTAPLPKASDVNHDTLISRAEVEWRRAAYLAARITNPTYRSEMLYRVAENEAYGSQTIVNEFPHASRSAHDDSTPRIPDALDNRSDRLLLDAAAMAKRIERPVWRDRAVVTIVYAAAASRQFARGFELARSIPQPEVRTDALVRLAESQAKKGDPDGATRTYQEAATAVASIPLDDPRAVLTGVLIDNLISVGRFDDARSTVVLYADNARRLLALGAIAEAQGFRGVSDSANTWIKRDAPAESRAYLLRRVQYGVLGAIEQNRSRDLSNRER